MRHPARLPGFLASGLLLLGLSWVGAVLADVRFDGVASDPGSGAPMYEEHHYLRRDAAGPSERLVLYRCLDGRAFARKRVNYAATATTPTFALEDARFGYREGVRQLDGNLIAWVQRSEGSREKSASVEVSQRLVIDAGFDEFVLRHWERLQRGDMVALDFLIPSRQKTYRFELQRMQSEIIGGEPASVMRLRLGGLFGLFADDIAVTYRDRDRRLMRFAGLTNVRENPDDNLVARIDFPPEREQPLDAVGWQTAADEPLAACNPGS